jgi:hypothetical protein
MPDLRGRGHARVSGHRRCPHGGGSAQDSPLGMSKGCAKACCEASLCVPAELSDVNSSCAGLPCAPGVPPCANARLSAGHKQRDGALILRVPSHSEALAVADNGSRRSRQPSEASC